MKTAFRSVLALGLLLGLALTASTALASDAKDVESTPQAKVYRASLKAIDSGDYAAYTKCMTSEAVKEIEKQTKEMGKTPKDGMEMMKMMAPSDVKLTNLKVDGKKAVLSATGKQDKETMYGTVNLEEEKGEWKVGKQSWTNKKS
jgi:ketosteroid isomerase-like protein